MRITVGDLMNPVVHRLEETQTLLDAARLFLSFDLSRVYILTNNDEFLGILTDYALIKARLSGLKWDQHVDRLISRGGPTINAGQEISAAIPLFREGRGDIIPVLHEGLLVGELGRQIVLRMMLALDPTCPLASPKELDDEPLLEKLCESEMKQEHLKDGPTVSLPLNVGNQRSRSEKVIPAPHLMQRKLGMISSLNAPEDLFPNQP